MTAAAAQIAFALALPPADPARCPRCGRDWPGVFVRGGMDVGALLRLPQDLLDAAVRCWVGACGGRG